MESAVDVEMEMYLAVAAIALVAFFIKGIMGTGTTITIVALGSIVFAPKETIMLAAVINVFGGFAMLHLNRGLLNVRYVAPIAVVMMIGAAIGAFALTIIDPHIFRMILAVVFFVVALQFFFTRKAPARVNEHAPEKALGADYLFGWVAGMCGGFVGINAPVLVYHFSKALNKTQLRRLLVIIFIPAAITQSSVYAISGALNMQIVYYALAMLPMMGIGIYLGNKMHIGISEVWFRRILGAFLMMASIKMVV